MACGGVECPLNNVVSAGFSIAGGVDTLKETLTVRALKSDNSDTILVNQLQNATSFRIPMSYTQEEDVLVFEFTDVENNFIVDTVSIQKTNILNVSAIECPPNYFHSITNVSTTHNRIADLSITNSNVNYGQNENFMLYIK